MIAARGATRTPRVAVVPGPPTELPGLLEANDAVVCCTCVHGGRAETDALVRDILAAALETTPREADLVRTPGGKPYLATQATGLPLNFNISHSGDVLLVALSRSAEVGVDVERVRAVPEWRAIATRMFDAAVCAELFAEVACGADEHDAFIREWCRHEAAVKATGAGLFPSTQYTSSEVSAPTRILDLLPLPLPAGAARYRAALALRR